MKKEIYLDHAATTYTRQEVIDAMLPYMGEAYGNPSSLHAFGARAKNAVEEARSKIASVLHASPGEIYFTSGGTESDNWAIKGTAQANTKLGRHIITTKIEHPAVLETCKLLAKQGYEITYLDVDAYGFIDKELLKQALRPDTVMVSIMAANNEIGTIEPIEEIGKIIKTHSTAIFHVDAVQAAGSVKYELDKTSSIDLLSLSAHKFYGPKGIGALYIRKGTRIVPLHTGGHQERGKRAGTENVSGIIGMAKAFELAESERDTENKRLIALRDRLIDIIIEEIPGVHLNGHREKRLPNNVHFCFDYIEGESLLMRMDMLGIAASTGSACSSASLDPSHVLLAIGRSHETAHGSYRMTLGKNTTMEDIEYTAESLKSIVKQLREMSPFYNEGGESSCTAKK